MTRRSSDKKAIKLSCNELPEEQENFIYSWDLNLSSDEDIFLKGKSEILWSRTRDLFDYPDSFQSFSDFTGRTFSSCSWHNDEFDMKSSSKVNASLEAIDNALYEKVQSPFLSDVVFQECCDWSEKFPYFRIKGTKVNLPEIDNHVPFSVNTANIKHFDLENSTSSLHLEGKKIQILSASKSKGMPYNVNENKVPTNFEETVNNVGEYEEYFAVHKSDQPSECMEVPINEISKSQTTIKLLQDKVLDKLVSDMWPTVLAFLENLDSKQNNSINDDLQLPPIHTANEQKRILGLKRPKTEGSSTVCTEFPKLESMLTVSPKILQKRDFGCISRVTRPSSEMSVNLRMPSKSMKSAYNHSSNIRINCENSVIKNLKGEAENLCLVLPALEEDFQDTSSVLRGFHIEPGRKDSTNKNVPSPRNEYDISSTSRDNAYFLPPIEDKNYVPSNVKLTKNLFTFYGSPVRQDKSKYPGSARYKKTNSRPNTSVSKKTIKNHEVTRPLPVNSGLYITAKGVSKISSNVYIEKNPEVSFAGNETAEGNQEKTVTLFPIVTSLTPHEDKNTSVKKGLLHSFLGAKKT